MNRNSSWKRLIDLFFGLLLFLILLPVMVVIALLVKSTSKGGALFIQRRIGKAGRLFHCYKFRTMISDAESRLDQLLRADAKLRRQWHKCHKIGKDPRVTRLGYWLRRTSLDELPQLWNVIRGEMSLVGPRPFLLRERHAVGGEILSVLPGLTGLAQISGRSLLSFKERLSFDRDYVKRRSLTLDLWLLLRTVPLVLTGRGAY
jgi:exopolysaccharide production protein ExoY